MGVLSEIDGRPLCYPAFLLVVLLRKSFKHGVNSLSAAERIRAGSAYPTE